jgi:hypothetical protein
VEDGVHPPQTTRYAYSGGQVLEEQDNTGAPKASYVYGRYIDEPVQMKRGNSTVYYQSDDLYNVTALTNTAGEDRLTGLSEETLFGVEAGMPICFLSSLPTPPPKGTMCIQTS